MNIVMAESNSSLARVKRRLARLDRVQPRHPQRVAPEERVQAEPGMGGEGERQQHHARNARPEALEPGTGRFHQIDGIEAERYVHQMERDIDEQHQAGRDPETPCHLACPVPPNGPIIRAIRSGCNRPEEQVRHGRRRRYFRYNVLRYITQRVMDRPHKTESGRGIEADACRQTFSRSRYGNCACSIRRERFRICGCRQATVWKR